jgi:hypothetical protein
MIATEQIVLVAQVKPHAPPGKIVAAPRSIPMTTRPLRALKLRARTLPVHRGEIDEQRQKDEAGEQRPQQRTADG